MANYSGTILNSGQAQTLYQGDTSYKTTVNSHGGQYVSSGGMASATMVNSGGVMVITSGGRARSTLGNSGGNIHILSGGSASSTELSGGTMFVSHGGFVSTTIITAGTMHLFGGIAKATFVADGGKLIVTNDAWADSVALGSGTVMSVYLGGSATNVWHNAGAAICLAVVGGNKALISGTNAGGAFLLSNGIARNFILYSGGDMLVSSGGSASGTIINAGGNMRIGNGGIARSSIVNSAGQIFVLSGGSANNTSACSGAMMTVSSGGRAENTELISGGAMVIFSGGFIDNTEVFDDGEINLAGGSARNTVISRGGEMFVGTRAMADTVVVNLGATLYTLGGSAINIWQNRGGALRLEVMPGDGTVISGANTFGEFSLSGGVAKNIVLYASGEIKVESAGRVQNTVISSGASMTLFEGANATNTKIYSGGLLAVDGGTAGKDQVYAGGEMRVSAGGKANSTIVNSLGVVHVSRGGLTSSATLDSGGSLQVSSGGKASASVVNFGGTMQISSGGAAESTLVSGGLMTVLPGANAGTTVVMSGTMLISGTAKKTTVSSGGILFVYTGAIANSVQLNSGAAIAVFFNRNDSTYISGTCETGGFSLSGGKASGFVLNSRGYLGVEGAAVNTVINSGGLLTVWSGSTATGVVQNSGGSIRADIMAGDNATIITGTNEQGAFSLANGVARNFVVDNAYIFATGTASNTIVRAGSFLDVCSGGIARGTVVGSGCALALSDSATASNTTVEADGAIYMNGGIIGATTRLTGKMEITGSAANSGTLLFDISQGAEDGAIISGFSNLSGGSYGISAETRCVTGYYTLTDRAGSFASMELRTSSGVYTLTAGTALTVGNVTYKVKTDGASTVLDAVGKFDSLYGWADGSDYRLIAENCRVREIVAGADGDVSGSVHARINLLVQTSPCNIYGGGNNVNVGGAVNMSVGSGGYSGMIYGGSRAYQENISVGMVNLEIGAIVQNNNVKMLKYGATAWIVGGGVAAGGTLDTGNVAVNISGARLVHVVGGAQADGTGNRADVANVTIRLADSTLEGDLFAGGYAYDHAVSTAASTRLTIDVASAMVTVNGGIYGGGANPSHPSKGGNSLVTGDSAIVFTGSGDNLSVGTVSGDGKVAGSVAGEKVLEFDDFTGRFLGALRNFDTLVLGGSTVVEYSGECSFSTICFDLSDRDTPLMFADGFSFGEDDKLMKIELGDTSGDYDLMTCADSDALEGLRIELYNKGAQYASFDYGESGGGYTVVCSDGMLCLNRQLIV